MTKDDVMVLANQTAGQHWMDEAHIQRFAVALISAEREACAKVCEEHPEGLNMFGGHFVLCAQAIRARGEA